MCWQPKFIASTAMQMWPTFSSMNKGIVQLHRKLIPKVGDVNVIINLIAMNLRKQFASAETLYNKVSLQK